MSHLRPLLGVLALTALLAARTLPVLAEELVLSAASSVPGVELLASPCASALPGPGAER